MLATFMRHSSKNIYRNSNTGLQWVHIMLFYKKSFMPHTTGLVVTSPDKHTPPHFFASALTCTCYTCGHVWLILGGLVGVAKNMWQWKVTPTRPAVKVLLSTLEMYNNCMCFLKGREKRQLGAASIILELPNEVRCGRSHVLFSVLPPHHSACQTDTAMADKRSSTW